MRRGIWQVLALLALLLSSPRVLHGADYYVSTTGSNTAPYDTWAKAATGINTILSLALAGSNTIYVAPGTYTAAGDGIYLTEAKHSNLTITGALGVSAGDASESVRDTVIFWSDPANNRNGLYDDGDADTVTVKNLTIKCSTNSKYGILTAGTADGLTFRNVRVWGATGKSGQLIELAGATNWLFDRCLFINNDNNMFHTTGASSGTVQYTLSQPDGGDFLPGSDGLWYFQHSSGTVNMYNSVLNAVRLNGAGTLNVVNCLLIGGDAQGAAYTVTRSAGTLNYSYNYISPIPLDQTLYVSAGATDGGGNILGGSPKITSPERHGYVVLSVDDARSTSLAYLASLGALLTPYSFEATWFVDRGQYYPTSGISESDITSVLSGGTWEIGSHGHSHTKLDRSNAGTITRAGGGTIRYKNDFATTTFSVDVDNDDVADLTYVYDATKSVVDLEAWLDANDVQTWSWSNGGDSTIKQETLLTSLSDVAAWTSTGTALALDKTSGAGADCTAGGCARFYKDEVYDTKAWLEGFLGGETDPQTGIAYVTNSFATAFTVSTTDVSAATRTTGYLGNRGNAGSALVTLASKDLYNHYTYELASLVSSDAAVTRKNIENLMLSASTYGYVIFLLAHTEAECSTTTVAHWPTVLAVLNEWSQAGHITVDSMQQVMAEVRASPWSYAAATGITSKTYDIDEGDYVLLGGSPLLHVGTSSLTLTTDYGGNSVIAPVDIGLYDTAGCSTLRVGSDVSGIRYSPPGCQSYKVGP